MRTPPWLRLRRASEVVIPKASANSAGQVNRGLSRRPVHRWDLGGSFVADVDAVELQLCRSGGLLAVEAGHERPGEGSLGVSRTQVRRRRDVEQQRVPGLERGVRDAERLSIDLGGRVGHTYVVVKRLRHAPLAVGTGEDRHRHDRLLVHSIGALDIPPSQEVELLVRSAELDIRGHGHGVVSLQQRVEQLEQGDGRPGTQPAREILALDHLGDSHRARQAEELFHRHIEPFAVVADLDPVAIEHGEGLLLVGAGVLFDLLGREDRSGVRTATGVTDASGEVADDEHDDVAGVLELPQFLQHDGVTQVDVGRGGVDAELHPHGTAELELVLELACGQRVDGVALKPRCKRLGARLIPTPTGRVARGIHRGPNARLPAPHGVVAATAPLARAVREAGHDGAPCAGTN